MILDKSQFKKNWRAIKLKNSIALITIFHCTNSKTQIAQIRLLTFKLNIFLINYYCISPISYKATLLPPKNQMAILYSPPKNLNLRINYGRNLRITIIPTRFWVNLMRLVVKSGVSIFNFMVIIFRRWPLPRLLADNMKNNCHRRCLGSCWDLNLTHVNIQFFPVFF